MVIHVKGDLSAQIAKAGKKLVVVDYSAVWCGPCQSIKSFYASLATKYRDVVFLEVDEADNKSEVAARGVRGFPTFQFYLNGKQVDEFSGANPSQLEATVTKWMPKVFDNSNGVALGGASASSSSGALDAAAIRAARVAAMNNVPVVAPPKTNIDAKAIWKQAVGDDDDKDGMDIDGGGKGGEDEALAAAIAASLKEETKEAPSSKMVCDGDVCYIPTDDKMDTEAAPSEEVDASLVVPVVDAALRVELEEMGFAPNRIIRGLYHTKNGGIEQAIAWIADHEDDADIDAPLLVPAAPAPSSASAATIAAGVAQSIKCDDCGAILRDTTYAELHAERTGHTNFSESYEGIRPLSEEDKARKVLELKQKIATKKAERERREKEDELAREKARRADGQTKQEIQEEMDAIRRKKEADAIKAEKIAVQKEREKIQALLAKDKVERAAAKAIREGRPPPTEMAAVALGKVQAEKTPVDKMNDAAKAIEKSNFAGRPDGNECLKILKVYCENCLLKDEDKYRSINMENKVYLARVSNVMGGSHFLIAAGFVVDTESKTMKYPTPVDKELLTKAVEILSSRIY